MKTFLRYIVWNLYRICHIAVCYVVYISASCIRLFWRRGEYFRWLFLGCVATRKVESGAIEKAKSLADELLTLSRRYENNWYYGNAIHKGNLILGRVAVRNGNLELAKVFLLKAGNTPGSPQLDSFGPNMSLALELLKAGESEAVLEYFKLCGNFWEIGASRLTRWTDIVQKGQIPRFGGNLYY